MFYIAHLAGFSGCVSGFTADLRLHQPRQLASGACAEPRSLSATAREHAVRVKIILNINFTSSLMNVGLAQILKSEKKKHQALADGQNVSISSSDPPANCPVQH